MSALLAGHTINYRDIYPQQQGNLWKTYIINLPKFQKIVKKSTCILFRKCLYLSQWKAI